MPAILDNTHPDGPRLRHLRYAWLPAAVALIAACTPGSDSNARGPGAVPAGTSALQSANPNAPVVGAGGVGPSAAGPGGINAPYYSGQNPDFPRPGAGRSNRP